MMLDVDPVIASQDCPHHELRAEMCCWSSQYEMRPVLAASSSSLMNLCMLTLHVWAQELNLAEARSSLSESGFKTWWAELG